MDDAQQQENISFNSRPKGCEAKAVIGGGNNMMVIPTHATSPHLIHTASPHLVQQQGVSGREVLDPELLLIGQEWVTPRLLSRLGVGQGGR